jgi:hypothetical protein
MGGKGGEGISGHTQKSIQPRASTPDTQKKKQIHPSVPLHDNRRAPVATKNRDRNTEFRGNPTKGVNGVRLVTRDGFGKKKMFFFLVACGEGTHAHTTQPPLSFSKKASDFQGRLV